jgi:hypothetical protein
MPAVERTAGEATVATATGTNRRVVGGGAVTSTAVDALAEPAALRTVRRTAYVPGRI